MKRNFYLPSETEDAAINEAISNDSDTLEWSDQMFQQAKPAESLIPEVVETYKKAHRGKQRSPTKVQLTVRLSPEVIAYFKETGKGWQTRLDDVLKKHVHSH
ncbi:MAG: BrnA antitoxin family protein [Gammaproteobacteria bacterium]|nr:BrnA antitoxin family protein [Gammaproteobacteria bacterium]